MARQPTAALDDLASLLSPVTQRAEAIDLHQSPALARAGELQEAEDDLLGNATDILAGAMRFVDIDPENPPTVVPREWVERYGSERAERIFRAAKAGWMSKKEAPVGIAVAEAVHRSITKARAAAGGQQLQMNTVFITQNNYTYEEMEVDGEDK